MADSFEVFLDKQRNEVSTEQIRRRDIQNQIWALQATLDPPSPVFEQVTQARRRTLEYAKQAAQILVANDVDFGEPYTFEGSWPATPTASGRFGRLRKQRVTLERQEVANGLLVIPESLHVSAEVLGFTEYRGYENLLLKSDGALSVVYFPDEQTCKLYNLPYRFADETVLTDDVHRTPYPTGITGGDFEYRSAPGKEQYIQECIARLVMNHVDESDIRE